MNRDNHNHMEGDMKKSIQIILVTMFLCVSGVIGLDMAFGQGSQEVETSEERQRREDSNYKFIPKHKDNTNSPIKSGGYIEKYIGPKPDPSKLWFNRWKIKEDMAKFNVTNTLWMAPLTKKMLKEGKTLFRTNEDFLFKVVVDNKKLKWTSAGVKDIDGKQMHLWLMAIDLPASKENMISISGLKISGASFVFFIGNQEDINNETSEKLHFPGAVLC